MYIFLTILSVIITVGCSTICESDLCVCRYNNKNIEDSVGEYVDCSYNKPSILLSNHTLPPFIYSLYLSSSNLTSISPTNLLQSKTLVELSLNDNALTEITGNVLQLPDLKRLDLSDNSLEFIERDTFKDLKKLEYLNLANNRFTTFEKLSLHRLSNLQEVILDNNELGATLQHSSLFDRKHFGLTRKIKSLSISGINLNAVPENFFSDAYDIKKLIISNNNLSDIFELPFTLEYLDLSDNPIKEITVEDFSDMPALKELKLNNLQIVEVPEFVFSALHALINLELERNRNLTEFNSLAFGQEVLEDSDDFILEKLSLKGSRVSKLKEELLEPFGQLLILDLQGNPWKCDCNLVWLKKLQITEQYYDHLRCFSPMPLYNARIFELDSKYFSCPANKRYIAGLIAAVSLCVTFAAVAISLFICVPRCQSRSNFLRNTYMPTAAYSVLPMTTTIHH